MKMKSSSGLFNTPSSSDFDKDFSLQDKLHLVEIIEELLSDGQKDILQPTGIEITRENRRLMTFIHNSILWEKPPLTKSDLTWMFDPATQSDALSRYIEDHSFYKVGLISLDVQSRILTIYKQKRTVNINNQGMQFLQHLLDSSPNTVTNKGFLKFIDGYHLGLEQSEVDNKLSVVRRDMFGYLKSTGFSPTSIDYLTKKIQNQEKTGYKIVS